jgi:hypothetical protein
VTVINELIDVGESIVANTNYGVSIQVQRKTTGNQKQDSRLYFRYFNCNQQNVNHESFTSSWHNVIV